MPGALGDASLLCFGGFEFSACAKKMRTPGTGCIYRKDFPRPQAPASPKLSNSYQQLASPFARAGSTLLGTQMSFSCHSFLAGVCREVTSRKKREFDKFESKGFQKVVCPSLNWLLVRIF